VFPPLHEQRAIAAFLDRECGKMDALVAEQERLIALLKKKRQAVISHAVTKGLDPTAPMKDSGVPWLEQVPSHWTITPLKRVISFRIGWTPPTNRDDLYDGIHPWATIADMSGRVIFKTGKSISNEAVRLAGIAPSPKGSLLFSFKLSVGQVCFAGTDIFTNEAIATFEPSYNVNLLFAYYAFPIFLVKNAFENIYGAKILNQDLMRNALLTLPPLSEQDAIAAFLDSECSRIDALIAEAETMISLLRERRSALISAAVTGQIDVRTLSGSS
jgi:type I restriction enzyme S subunit